MRRLTGANMEKIELKDTSKEDVKRLVIYVQGDGVDYSTGIKLNRQELYELYRKLREIFKDS